MQGQTIFYYYRPEYCYWGGRRKGHLEGVVA